jgi:radical SAM superfamily enzyme YgiQ (UPF0313 family)
VIKKLRIVLAAVHFEPGPDAVPLGAASVAAALKQAFRDAVEVVLAESFAAAGPEALVREISEKAADAVGFSLYSWNREVCAAAAKMLRRDPVNKGLFVFCGGPDASARSGGLLVSQGGFFDSVVKGEGEEQAVWLIRERFPWVENVTHSEKPEKQIGAVGLENLPSPWLDRTLSCQGLRGRGVLWELARGCPYCCAYCYESKGDRRVRYFGEHRIRRELELFICERPAYVFILDPTFNIDEKRGLRILDMIIEKSRAAGFMQPSRRNPIHWHFEIRGELVTKAQARRFALLGASLQIGLQSADADVCAHSGRSFDRKRFSAGIERLNREGVVFGIDLIYGLPRDTLKGFMRSLDYALSLRPNNIDLFRLSVLPGTALWDWAPNLGIRMNPSAPYEVEETTEFPAADLDTAEALSGAADVFYNRGRAVAWFTSAVKPLRMTPSVFLSRFMISQEYRSLTERAACDSLTVEKAQLQFLEACYRDAKKAQLVPALRDLVRYHGAWGRALAEGKKTKLSFTYNPEMILGAGVFDIEKFAASVKPCPGQLVVGPE